MSLTRILSVLALFACAVAISDNSRIIGNIKLAFVGQFPWVASIRLDNEFACTGTLILNRWVLTTGACIGLYTAVPGRLTVLLGGVSMAGEPEPGRMEYSVDQAFHHDLYIEGDFYHHNLGLLHLSRNATGSGIGSAYLLPRNNTSIPAGFIGDFAGWGGNSNAAPTSLLKYAQMTTISPVQCEAELGVNFTSAQTCTSEYSSTDPNSASPCWYDQGGAFTTNDEQGNAYIVGVAAYPGCTDYTRPSVYTNPSHPENMDWILKYLTY